MVEISRLQEASEQAVADINALLPQLRSNPAEHAGSLEDLRVVVSDPTVILMVAKDGGRIVGMGSLYTIMKVGKRSATIEDVVVDAGYRDQGLGEKMTQALIDAGKALGITQIYLTSRFDRAPAHRLYEKLGFAEVETRVYRLKM